MSITHKKKNKFGFNNVYLFFVVLFLLLVIFLLLFVLQKEDNVSIENVNEEIIDIVKKEDSVDRKIWNRYKEINDDYVGQVFFESGLINKPFVQAKTCYKRSGEPYRFFNQDGSVVTNFDNYTGNDVYIWMDFETMEYDFNKKGGTAFMDYRNNLDDQNIIIYGHHFSVVGGIDPDRIKAFTPLEKLLELNNYEDNKKLKLILENETREYELWAVYEFDETIDEFFDKCQYYRPNYNVDDFTGEIDDVYYQNYIDYVNSIKLYDTDIDLTVNDKTLTLQTCMTPYNNLYEICVFKLIDSIEE